MTDPHAVRWARREIKSRFTNDWTRWHWTEDANQTLCGRIILVGGEGPGFLPQTHDDADKVDCVRCKAALDGGKGEDGNEH